MSFLPSDSPIPSGFSTRHRTRCVRISHGSRDGKQNDKAWTRRELALCKVNK